MNKTLNQKAWFFVIPVFVLVAFNAVVPLMTVVNYSFQETFGSNVFAWEGTRWFKEILHSERFHASLGRQFIFTFIILLIQLPLGIAIALTMPKKRLGSSCLFDFNVNAVVNTLECSGSYVEYICSSRNRFSWKYSKFAWF
jgi:glycerol transport system permease protein